MEKAIRWCGICETSCDDSHGYELERNKTTYVCDRCWKLIRAIIDESKPKDSKSKSK